MAAPLIRLGEPARTVLAQLRRKPMTVEEIAKALRLTSNAVRNQLRKLGELRLIERAGNRRGASKPSILYAITLDGQVQFSTLYLPVLTEFLEVAEGQCAGKQLVGFMTDTGRSLAKRYPRPSGNLKARADAAARLVRRFGGLMEVDTSPGELALRSASCPLAALTARNRAACHVLEGFLSEYLGTPVETCCETQGDPRCCFAIVPDRSRQTTRRRIR